MWASRHVVSMATYYVVVTATSLTLSFLEKRYSVVDLEATENLHGAASTSSYDFRGLEESNCSILYNRLIHIAVNRCSSETMVFLSETAWIAGWLRSPG